jgi:hypothetical protein
MVESKRKSTQEPQKVLIPSYGKIGFRVIQIKRDTHCREGVQQSVTDTFFSF